MEAAAIEAAAIEAAAIEASAMLAAAMKHPRIEPDRHAIAAHAQYHGQAISPAIQAPQDAYLARCRLS